VLSRIRTAMLGLLAVLLVGSAMAASASAAAGPFWHHREVGEKNEGAKIEEKSPETFEGKGGEQTLSSSLSGQKIIIQSKIVESKGEIFNNSKQGQIIVTNHYIEPKLVEPALKGCEVKVGTNNTVTIKGHLAWKWNGEEKQLTAENQREAGQTPDFIFTAIEPPQQKPAVKEINLVGVGGFTPITLSPAANCGALAGTFTVAGSDVGIGNLGLEEWSQNLTVRTISNPTPSNKELIQIYLQHYWDGEAQQGAKIGLTFAGEPASLVGQTNTKTTKQEVAGFEK
jgi:hypothetical protein